jgi:predicted ester cyclase
MTLEDNKALVQRFVEEIFNEGNTAAIASFCVPGSMFAGGIAGQVKSLKTAFPDYHLTVEYMFAEGDKVAVRGTMNGTNTGPLVGFLLSSGE